MNPPRYLLAVDAGGSTVRAVLYDKSGTIIERESKQTEVIRPEEGAIEYRPVDLFSALLDVMGRVIQKAGVSANDVAAIGIANQRSSFCLWERASGRPVTNLISWQDVRAADTADEMNRNILWRLLKKGAAIIRALTRDPFFTATSMLKMTTDQDTCRVRWLLKTRPGLREACEKGEILFGTLDTWFIYNLSGRSRHVTDYTNAAATGLFNPFSLKWNSIFCTLFKIPMTMLPEVLDSNGDFGQTDRSFFGAQIPIRAAIGDQQAALFGHCCFESGEVKISQGSGAFVDINVGHKPKLSRRGLFPMVAWVIGAKPVYLLEGFVATAGTLIDWLGMGMGITNTPKALNEYAAQCEDSEGVVFIPTPAGIRFPYFNPRMKASILGLSLSTHKRHVARAVLEGIAFRILDILEGIKQDTRINIKQLKVDGGVSRSDILLQCLADLSGLEVFRSSEPDMTSTGAAYLAGLAVGFWKSLQELEALESRYDKFSPHMPESIRQKKVTRWKRAVNSVLTLD